MQRIPALAAALALLWCLLTALAAFSLWDVHVQQKALFETITWVSQADARHKDLDDEIDELGAQPPGGGSSARLAAAREERRILRDEVSRIRDSVAADARKMTNKRMRLLALIVALLVGGGVLLVAFTRTVRRTTALEALRDDAREVSNSLRMEIHEFRDAMRVVEISEQRYRSVVEMQTELVIRFRPDGELRFVNEAFARYWERAAEHFIGTSVLEQIPQAQHEHMQAHLDSFSTETSVKDRELHVVRPDGSPAWQAWTDRALFDADDKLVEFQSAGRDVTKRREAEEALRKSEQRLRILAGRLQTAREDERKAIARELHDELGQSLTRLRFDIVLAGKACRDAGLHDRMDGMLELVDSTIQGVRRAATRLRPPLLDSMGLSAAIDWHASEYAKQSGTRIVRDLEEDLQMDDEASTALFRVTQEALTNIGRHAQADRVTIRLYEDDGDAVLEVEDNGRGIREPDAIDPRSSGLIGMRERADALGGTVVIGTPPNGSGTRVTFRVPLNGEEAS